MTMLNRGHGLYPHLGREPSFYFGAVANPWRRKGYATTARVGGRPKDIGDLVTTFIEGSVVRMSPVMGDLADGIDELEDRILQMDLSGIREKIVSTRRQAVIFNRFLAPQRDIVQRLTEASIPWLEEQDILRLREAQNDITRFVEDLQALRERSHSVQEEVANILTERLNRNTYVFSLIAAIFLPLSFLTGLLGINVPGIPGADDPEAFLVFCGILIAVVCTGCCIQKAAMVLNLSVNLTPLRRWQPIAPSPRICRNEKDCSHRRVGVCRCGTVYALAVWPGPRHSDSLRIEAPYPLTFPDDFAGA